jgi:hypothetical protein
VAIAVSDGHGIQYGCHLVKNKKSAAPDILMKYCPSWVSAKKKDRPKKDTRKLGIVDHVKEGVAKRRHKNPIAPDTAVKDGHDNTAHIREFVKLQSNLDAESKDGLVGNT